MKSIDWSKWNAKNDNFKAYSHISSRLIYGTPTKQSSLVSIMILTHKRARRLRKALDSALAQDYQGNYIISVIDDSGFDQATDDLMKIYCARYENVLYYRNEKNLGQYANWNRACELCPTDWYCLLHDDDELKPNYLTELVKYTDPVMNIGLIGVYIDVHDTRETASDNQSTRSRKIFNKLVGAFIKARGGDCIMLTIKDNIKHIYVMNSTFINKAKALEIGGLDSAYFPSSDFSFSAKMCYYYNTGFLPIKLTSKGIGDSESLKQSVCDDSIRCSYYQTLEMCKSLGFSEKQQKRKASVAAVISEIGVRGYNNVDYGKIKNELGMTKMYSNRLVIFMINVYSKVSWGLLLFRSKSSPHNAEEHS